MIAMLRVALIESMFFAGVVVKFIMGWGKTLSGVDFIPGPPASRRCVSAMGV